MTEGNRSRKRRRHNGALAVMVVLMLLIFASTIMMFLPEGGNKKTTSKQTPVPTVTPTILDTKAEEAELLGVVLEVDTEVKVITVYDVKAEQERNLIYIGATTFFDGYGIQMSAAQISPGGLYRFMINTKEEWITTACEAVDRTENAEAGGVWEKTGVDRFTVTQNALTFRGQNYRYSAGVCVMNNGKQISLSDLKSGVDIVTVRGIGQTIYEIVVTKGHGYITLQNHEDFIGGTITIGNSRIDTIEKTSSYLVREGTYEVTVDSGEYYGTEFITVPRDTTAVFDVFEYGSGPVQKGWLTINIEPLGATLYVDGVKTYYTDGLELDYGMYQFEFTEGGYTSYKAMVSIDQPKQSLSVYLIEQEGGETGGSVGSSGETSGGETGGEGATSGENTTGGETETGNNTETGSGTELDNGTENNGSETSVPTEHSSVSIMHLTQYELDLNSAIYILGPEGSDVYLDGTYLGKAPLDFEKIIGVYVIKIVRPDGKEKEFNVAETDNGDDSYYNFSWID